MRRVRRSRTAIDGLQRLLAQGLPKFGFRVIAEKQQILDRVPAPISLRTRNAASATRAASSTTIPSPARRSPSSTSTTMRSCACCLSSTSAQTAAALTLQPSSGDAAGFDAVRVQSCLAALLQDTNRLAEAEPLMRRALAIKEASLPDHHPSVQLGRENLKALLAAIEAAKREAPGDPPSPHTSPTRPAWRACLLTRPHARANAEGERGMRVRRKAATLTHPHLQANADTPGSKAARASLRRRG